MRQILIPFIIASIIISCGSKETTEEKKERTETEQVELKKSEKQKTIVELTWKYSIKYKLDTLDLNYSIDFKPLLGKSHILIDGFHVKDIFEKDSIYFISINTYSPIDELILSISKEQIDLFSNNDLDNILVVDLIEVKKIRFKYEGEAEGDETVSVSLGNSTGFSAVGKLIEIVSLKE